MKSHGVSIDLIDPEELCWPDVKPGWDQEQLLQQKGMFKFSKVKGILGMRSIELTRLSRHAESKGLDTYEVYGFAKPAGSQYILKMSRFRNTFARIKKKRGAPTNVEASDLRAVPGKVQDANQLIQLKGVFRFCAVCGFSPFKECATAIKNYVRSVSDQEEAMRSIGCWYDGHRREFIVDMEPFTAWFFDEFWLTASLDR